MLAAALNVVTLSGVCIDLICIHAVRILALVTTISFREREREQEEERERERAREWSKHMATGKENLPRPAQKALTPPCHRAPVWNWLSKCVHLYLWPW